MYDSDTKSLVRRDAQINKIHGRWSSIMQILALSTLLGKDIQSLFPDVEHYARFLYHVVITPLPTDRRPVPDLPDNIPELIILWSRSNLDNRPGVIYSPNHIVAVTRAENSSSEASTTIEPNSTQDSTCHESQTAECKSGPSSGNFMKLFQQVAPKKRRAHSGQGNPQKKLATESKVKIPQAPAVNSADKPQILSEIEKK